MAHNNTDKYGMHHTHTHTHIYTHAHKALQVYIYTHRQTYTYIKLCTYTHIHTLTYTHKALHVYVFLDTPSYAKSERSTYTQDVVSLTAWHLEPVVVYKDIHTQQTQIRKGIHKHKLKHTHLMCRTTDLYK
jgi:hypothetical protein